MQIVFDITRRVPLQIQSTCHGEQCPASINVVLSMLSADWTRENIMLSMVVYGICFAEPDTILMFKIYFVKEICPRGNNKVIIYFLIS